ncbi:MAG: hypothetical protein IT436_10825 [Phycisphaerales bacterium]|nr:hypothetical protein [Phycisphaerales bacterium]
MYPRLALASLLVAGAMTPAYADVMYDLGRGIDLRISGWGSSTADTLFAPSADGPWDSELEISLPHPSGTPTSTARAVHHSRLESGSLHLSGLVEASNADAAGGAARAEQFLSGAITYNGPDVECSLDIAALVIGGSSDFYFNLARTSPSSASIFRISLDDRSPASYHATGLLTAGTYSIAMQAFTAHAATPPGPASIAFALVLTLPAPGAPAAMLAALGLVARRGR